MEVESGATARKLRGPDFAASTIYGGRVAESSLDGVVSGSAQLVPNTIGWRPVFRALRALRRDARPSPAHGRSGRKPRPPKVRRCAQGNAVVVRSKPDRAVRSKPDTPRRGAPPAILVGRRFLVAGGHRPAPAARMAALQSRALQSRAAPRCGCWKTRACCMWEAGGKARGFRPHKAQSHHCETPSPRFPGTNANQPWKILCSTERHCSAVAGAVAGLSEAGGEPPCRGH